VIVAYTDGGCRGNPGGIGAWAFVLVDLASGRALERAGAEASTTNNRMEMRAAIEAMRALRRRGSPVVMRSDSLYLIKCCSKWLPGWKSRGWARKDGPLANVDLLQELDALLARHAVTWEWVRGHSGDPGNDRADALANAMMDALEGGRPIVHERRCTWLERA
jgi:ribonuclease HI